MSLTDLYQLSEKIYESSKSLVYRAISKSNNQSVILKILKDKYPDPLELTLYKQEYEITCSINSHRVVKAHSLQRHENSLMLALEDFGGISLNLLKQELPLEQRLSTAIKITESLEDIHKANIIHKDVNPSNIVYNPETMQLKIIDFGLSTQVSRENQSAESFKRLEGTLAYIAPEQTGRMNRGIDYRSDLYSLGITLYEFFTQQLPFSSNDPTELVHCHIAQEPTPPDHLEIPIGRNFFEVPGMISDIIMKLLAKAPEDRYQSALGVKYDLKNCLTQLQSRGKISQFTLRSNEKFDIFHIPHKLYGREAQINQLLTLFGKVSQGTVELALVSGYSGIGKSALVNEVRKPITIQKGYFITGKFDQLKRGIPYMAISQALQDLIDQLLSESKTKLSYWRDEILEAIAPNAQVIIDIVPKLEEIIGQQPPVQTLGITESQNRFFLIFQKFINVFSEQKNPLVIFIDDLQWADLASLTLIEFLATNPNSKYLFIIGAYRDNEVIPPHPLLQTVKQIEKIVGNTLHTITLQPLDTNQINQLISDTLSCSIEKAQPLADLIALKTQGNPFFLNQLLYYLYRNQQISFDNEKSSWQWDTNQIQKVSYTDNVIDLMVERIKNIDVKSQNVLKLAACIGNQFSLDVLSVINAKSQATTAGELQAALLAGLIIPLTHNYKIPLFQEQESKRFKADSSEHFSSDPKVISYKFLHDRVQQAAYSLINVDEKKATHLQIGRLLTTHYTADELDAKLFDVVNQLNEGHSLISQQQERNFLAELNLQAGRRAKSSTAYKIALSYLETGLEFLAQNSWEHQYQLTLDLHLETIDTLYSSGKFEKIEEISETVLAQTQDILDQLKVYQTKILYYNTTFQSQKAIDTAFQVLPRLKISLSVEEDNIAKRFEKQQQEIKLFLGDKRVEYLAELPVATDQYKLAGMLILQQIISAAHTTNFPLFIETILTQLNLCIRHGNSSQSASIYVTYGMLLCSVIKDINSGYEFGKLAMRLLEDSKLEQSESFVLQMYYGQVWHWKESLREKIAQKKLLRGIEVGVDTGENEFASYAAINYCLIKFLGGQDLEEVDYDYQKYSKYLKGLKQQFCVYSIDILHSIVSFLRGDRQGYFFIGKSESEEEQYLQEWLQNNSEWLLFFIYFSKMVCFYFFKNYPNSFRYGTYAKKYVNSLGAYLTAPQYNFYFSLSSLGDYHGSNLEDKTTLIHLVETNQESMKVWANSCPENFQHKYDLIEAEKASVLGEKWEASELYEKAIQGAKKSDFLHEEALAYEQAARFYFNIRRDEIAQVYLKNAYHCYTRWGATSKVKQLEEEYSQYLLGISSSNKSRKLSTTTSTTANDSEILDLNTVLKASQAISSEIKLGNLLSNLMRILIESAGAQKGFLILGSSENWVIEAQGVINDNNLTILKPISITSKDPKNSDAILPKTIINYVSRTQETTVLDDATNEGQFIGDSYIVTHKIKSILCTPLLNQGQLKGMVYLENNLTTGAFTTDRVELLNVLAAQAAISIDNSRLYQNLEQRVEERTKELSQTLDVLKATQAELIFENDLLRSDSDSSTFDYQVGGSLPMDSPTYVVRSADRNLYKTLRQGEFCYILNARQMGKSSLMVRMMNHLQREGVNCAAIDMTRIGSENVTPEQWYKGLAVELWRSFGLLRTVNLKTWWNERLDISPIQRLGQFIEEVILVEVGKDEAGKVVLFIDEIDSVLGLDFPVSDFFRLIRFCYNQRTLTPEYQRLTFALFGVATPSELISDRRRTPFNIGQAIQLDGFKEHEAQPLLNGLTDKVTNPQVLLKEILYWTGGQPFLTQKVCEFIRQSSELIPINQEATWVETLVRKHIIDNWEDQDEPEHLKTIRDRILKNEHDATQILTIYQQVLTQPEVMATDSAEEKELILSGLVIKEDNRLKVRNQIYLEIFNRQWLENTLGQML